MPINYTLVSAAITPEATPEHLLAYLRNRADTAEEDGRPTSELDAFFNPERDWPQVAQARQWWPTDRVRVGQTWGESLSVAMNAYCPLVQAHAEPTLLMALHKLAAVVAVVYAYNGGDPEHTNESKSERMKRLNRERVAAHRQRTRQDEEAEGPNPVAVAWAEVVRLQEQKRIAHAEHSAEVQRLQQDMCAASERRRQVDREWDELIAAARAAHEAARAADAA